MTDKIVLKLAKKVTRNSMQMKAVEDDLVKKFILFVEGRGRGYAFKLAQHLGVTHGYIGHVIHRRKPFSVTLAERIIEKGLPD